MGVSLYWRNLFLGHIFRVSSAAIPVAGYMALFTSNPEPGDVAGVATGTEATYTNYLRQAVTFASASGGVIANSTAVTFPTSASAGGTATYAAFYDASSGGKLIGGFTIAATSLASGAIPTIAIGACTMTATTV